MAKFFAWVLFLFSVACFASGFYAQQILAEGEIARRDNARPLPQAFVVLDCQDYDEP